MDNNVTSEQLSRMYNIPVWELEEKLYEQETMQDDVIGYFLDEFSIVGMYFEDIGNSATSIKRIYLRSTEVSGRSLSMHYDVDDDYFNLDTYYLELVDNCMIIIYETIDGNDGYYIRNIGFDEVEKTKYEEGSKLITWKSCVNV